MRLKYSDFYCNYCREAFSRNLGIKGERADLTKLFFVLHRSDSREPQPHSPATYHHALLKSQTGKILAEMLGFCCLTVADVYLTNFYKCLLPRDREPRAGEYRACLQVLKKQIIDFQPRKIVIFGRQVYRHMFRETAKQNDYREMAGKILDFNGFPVFISYHPGWIWSFPTESRKEYYGKIKKFLQG